MDASVSAIPTAGLKDLITSRRLLRREIDGRSADLVIVNSLRAAVAVAVASPQTPCFYYVRQDMTPASLGRVNGVLAKKFVFPRFDGFIANSKWTLGTVPRNLLRSVPYGVAYPISGVTIGDRTRLMERNVSDLRVVWVGRLAPWKGLHVVIEALEHLERTGVHVRLSVAGAAIHEGHDYAERLQSLASRLTNSPIFLGHIADIPELLAGQDVLVHSSVRPEPFGQVLIQGMAAGLAVVATEGGGPDEVIQDGRDGLLIPPGNPELLAKTLAGLAGDRGKVAAIGHEAQRSVQDRFDDVVLAEGFDKLVAAMYAETKSA